ncbi:MAG: SufD family Fe-S cluster assembly protein [Alistipes sp.]|jgi:Fe-S cluster assembly protein SufD|nr:SufD family Fe-S cluster assembly protein [Alistipes sp.]
MTSLQLQLSESPVNLSAGVYRVDPLVVEAGSRSIHIVAEAGAKIFLTAFVLATDNEAGLSLTVDLAGAGAEFNLHGLYVVAGFGETAGEADIDVRVNHLAPDCVSRQLVKGIAAGEATGRFAGMVHVAREAQRTDAEQQSRNLQLSDSAHVYTRPQLEIYADDVRCSHGASVGRLDEEAIFYMRQRGVAEADARRMQLHGFANEIVDHCPSEGFKALLATTIGGIVDHL